MTVELVPSFKCNLQCGYCYQNPIRDAGNYGPDLDLEAVKGTLREIGGKFTIFGGEPLLTPIEELEELWRFGVKQNRDAYERGESVNSIQTNGVLITEEHIQLFQEYAVGVGISMDGPGELNDSRWRGSVERTREATAKTEANIDRLIEAGVMPSLIVTLHRLNAGDEEKRDRLKAWFLELEEKGITHVNLHSLEVDGELVAEKWALEMDEYTELILDLMKFEREELSSLGFRHTQDQKQLLAGDDRHVTCTYGACDPWTTRAVDGVDGAGNRSNCGRTYKDGVTNIKAERPGYERYIALYHTPMEDGGCKGCRFFVLCKGDCPGQSEESDWRSKTMYCPSLMVQYEFLERAMMMEGQLPITQSPELPEVERAMLDAWKRGENPRIHSVIQQIRNGGLQRASAGCAEEHGDSDHGDAPHGDHTDHARVAQLPVISEGDRHQDYHDHGDAPHGDSG